MRSTGAGMAGSKEESGGSTNEAVKDLAVIPNPKESASETPQRSPLSRTTDEIQKSAFSPASSLGSLNLEELLSNMWNVEDGGLYLIEHHPEAEAHPAAETQVTAIGGRSASMTIHRESSGPVTAGLCRKTGDETWPMTLEDFLAKAGPARESSNYPLSTRGNLGQFLLPGRLHESHHQFGIPGIHVTEAIPESAPAVRLAHHDRQLPHAITAVYAHRNMPQLFSVGSPVSSVSSDGFCGGWRVDSSNSGGQQTANAVGGSSGGGEGDGVADDPSGDKAGKKRNLDSTVELVRERRLKRLIKNRESAHRSRARKEVRSFRVPGGLAVQPLLGHLIS